MPTVWPRLSQALAQLGSEDRLKGLSTDMSYSTFGGLDESAFEAARFHDRQQPIQPGLLTGGIAALLFAPESGWLGSYCSQSMATI